MFKYGFEDSLQQIQTVVQKFKDPMEASEAIKKLTHPLLLEADGLKEKLLQLMTQAEMLHEYKTDIIRIDDPSTINITEQNIRETILELVNSIQQ